MLLNSWKEIAAYMGRGVRTVQRWERDLGLPVRRPRAKMRSAVIALSEDLDQWLHSAPSQELEKPELELASPNPPASDEWIRLEDGATSQDLLAKCERLKMENQQALTALMEALRLTMALREMGMRRRNEPGVPAQSLHSVV